MYKFPGKRRVSVSRNIASKKEEENSGGAASDTRAPRRRLSIHAVALDEISARREVSERSTSAAKGQEFPDRPPTSVPSAERTTTTKLYL